jgi:hypothetical protein
MTGCLNNDPSVVPGQSIIGFSLEDLGLPAVQAVTRKMTDSQFFGPADGGHGENDPSQ